MTKRIIIVVMSLIIMATIAIASFFLLRNNKKIEIKLPINDETERWVYKLDNSGLLKFKDVEKTDKENIFTFKINSFGKTTIIFEKYVGSEVDEKEMKSYTVTIDKEKNATIEEHVVDNKFEIKQSMNSGVEFKWIYSIENEDIVKLVDITEKGEDELVDGGLVDITYTFKALKKGRTTITFKYISLDGTITDETRVYNISVDKNMNINIEEKIKR